MAQFKTKLYKVYLTPSHLKSLLTERLPLHWK